MSEKTPRLRAHENQLERQAGIITPNIPRSPLNPYVKQYTQRLGRISLTDGVPVITENILGVEGERTTAI